MAVDFRRVISRTVQELDGLAGFWIGQSRPSPAEAVEHADWQADRPDAYCSRCGSTVGPGEATITGCGHCRGRTMGTDRIVRLGAYEGPLRDWVMGVKYQRWGPMGEYLGHRLGESLKASDEINRDRAVVIPVPMPWTRRMYRGIDHTEVIARAVASVLDAPLAKVLARRHGLPQTQLPRADRRRNAHRGMYQRFRLGGWPLEDLDLILIDDVRTTGSTLRAAARRLRPFRPRMILGAVVAVADEAARRRRAEQKHSDFDAPGPDRPSAESPTSSRIAQ
ncbi:MAG: ComF family protein [Phycisphaerales bacterium]|nr:MAG: ComF family protein [Phycisphaerales bacterium]